MRRLPLYAFAALAVASVFAFFEVQHLKTSPPVSWGHPQPLPAAFNPKSGRRCYDRTHQLLNYRHTTLTLSLSEAENIGVYVTNSVGNVVATVSQDTSMPATKLGKGPYTTFVWNGHESNGQLASAGYYHFRVVLLSQNTPIDASLNPIQVITSPPHPKVTGLSYTPTITTGTTTATSTSTATSTTTGTATTTTPAATSGPVVLTPPQGGVTVHFKPVLYRRAWVDVYKTDVSGKPELINHFKIKDTASGSTVWNGETPKGAPAPAGTYLIGITAQDMACNVASYPGVVPPSAGTTPGLGVTVRYLSATPPLTPTAAGSSASVQVQSPAGGFDWALRQAGHGKVLERGSGASGDQTIAVLLPGTNPALYKLTVSSGSNSTSIPLVAYATGGHDLSARVLVVLPMLSWQGENPVDDTGDGLPSTLSAGDSIQLYRPLVGGLPSSYDQDATLLSYLNSQHVRYQLTTDIALAEGVGPSLVDRWGVLLAGPETWLPDSTVDSHSLVKILHGFVQYGGRMLSLGTGALSGTSVLSGDPSDLVAAAPVLSHKDLFGATHGANLSTGGDLITELSDQLDIFGEVPVFPAFKHFESIEPPAGAESSLAGIEDGSPAVAAFKSGHGLVMEVGLTGFTASLGSDLDSQELLNRLWQLLAK